jgi:hypothetical protein
VAGETRARAGAASRKCAHESFRAYKYPDENRTVVRELDAKPGPVETWPVENLIRLESYGYLVVAAVSAVGCFVYFISEVEQPTGRGRS